jgi:uncharacterized tellurite resistance protein B-like protein
VWGKVSSLLGLKDQPEDNGNELQLATAALLVHVSLVDNEFSGAERSSLLDCLEDQFGLSSDTAAQILGDAEAEQQDASCLYKFTKIITAELDQEGRQDIVRLLWRVAYADNHLDNFEANFLAKIAGLLGVSPEDRIRIKHEVMS